MFSLPRPASSQLRPTQRFFLSARRVTTSGRVPLRSPAWPALLSCSAAWISPSSRNALHRSSSWSTRKSTRSRDQNITQGRASRLGGSVGLGEGEGEGLVDGDGLGEG